MKRNSSLRTPYRTRAFSPAGSAARVDDAGLGRGIAWAQLALWTLCAARADADMNRGALTLEGHIAVALLVVLTVCLAAKTIDWAVRATEPRMGGSQTAFDQEKAPRNAPRRVHF